jgi:allophanate hydrolase
MNDKLFTLSDWKGAYEKRNANPRDVLQSLLDGIDRTDPAWISVCSDDFLKIQLGKLESLDPSKCPLYGVPFAVKDNIDAIGFNTTAACPEFSFTPQKNATLVSRLQSAGAILIGKTNLDQFATGLVGVRSPYGHVPNTFNAEYISGGSSSGSASVVARGIVPFAIGTDTAGSGRIPAGFNNIVGLKPTPGSIPMNGVLPACRTIDVFSIFALTVADAAGILSLLQGADDEPTFNTFQYMQGWFGVGDRKIKVGIPKNAHCDERVGYQTSFDQSIEKLNQLNLELIEVGMGQLNEVAQLLYDGPWVAERYAVIQGLLSTKPNVIDPTVKKVIEKASDFDSKDTFNAMYRLAQLRVAANAIWKDIDVLMVPTAPTIPTLNELVLEPIKKNSELGEYTNFVNLLGWSAISVPADITCKGLPFGVTFIAPAGFEYALINLGNEWQAHARLPLGANLKDYAKDDGLLSSLPLKEDDIEIAVVGAHLKGFPLYWQLQQRQCRFVGSTQTSNSYKLVALNSTLPPKPGLIRVNEGGSAIWVEIYRMPAREVGSFFALIQHPLGLGSIELGDGQWVKGFICEASASDGSKDISHFGGWKKYMESVS